MMALLKGDSAGSGGSTVGSAVATASGDIPLYAATFNKAASVPRGDLFVTVAITETRPEGAENRVAKQYYRFDIPLRQDGKPVRLTPNRLEIMGCSNFGDLTKNDLQIISENYRIIPFSLPRPYILLPSCVRNSTIKLTLSEMYEWPKAVCCGQAMEPVCMFRTCDEFLRFL